VECPADDALALSIYKRAQQIDQWEGENYSGTSVLAGMKAATEAGYFDEYRWAFGVEDLVRAVGYHGPAVLGVDWYEGMFAPDGDGYLRMTGALAGGHAICMPGVRCIFPKGKTKVFSNLDLDASWATLHNSWGANWGAAGRARISLRDLDALLKNGGEAAIPVLRRKHG
jgi:hypothetical protein